MNLFASEMDGVLKPIQIRFDPQGRIWVIGSTVYPQLEPGQTPNDKILVLEDTDHDGKCDKVTVFADGLMIPTGIELGDGGVYIGQGTELLFLKDTDGDLKADERRVVLRGFGTGDNHQNINSFMWGPGGELWFCQGLHTHSNVETPWGIVRMNQAGLWRFRPRLKKLEGFYGSAYEPQNPWGYVFTDWGEPIVIAGNNSSPIYPVPGLTSRHLDLAPTIIWKNGQGRKSSGADIVGTAHFPDEWQGTLITGGYINNAVWALRIVEDGSGFALEDREPLIKSSSRNFRPVDVKFGPDGALYICDWFNPIIGHYQASFRHPDRDKTHGRIWRVTAHGRELTKRPELAKASIPELLNDLESPDRWTWQFAKRVLADRLAEEVVPAVQKWAADDKRSEPGLKEALGVLQSHEAATDDLVAKLADGVDPGARAYAASVVGWWADRLHDPVSILRRLAEDENPRVRLHAIVAATYVSDARALDVLAAAAQRPMDKFIEYAFAQAVYALDALQRVRSLLSNESTGAERRFALWQILIRNGDSRDLQNVLLVQDSLLRRNLEPLMLDAVRSRHVEADAHAAMVLGKPVREGDPATLRLAGLWKLEQFEPDLVNA
ncbi:MAG TPA: PVC-type heme-binding CxxCH protein, partial [Verrucomicrobiae bacterium]|nr:PVC-type heme-binding CxxCH protein [Verrucomicrobiae bacterium]